MECGICYHSLDNSEYAKINNEAESGLYHVHCLEEWLANSNNGILTQNKISSYLIINGDTTREVQVNTETEPLLEEEHTLVFMAPVTSTSVPQLIDLNEHRTIETIDRGFRNRLLFCLALFFLAIILFILWRSLL